MNTFGKILRLTTFGESHGPAMGGVLDGFPPGFSPDFNRLQSFVDRRRPGTSLNVTQRKEADKVEFLSGFSPEGISLGTPIGFIVRNTDHRSSDYDSLRENMRPNHADLTYLERYGVRDHRGGGRASARETLSRVVAGALAVQWLESQGVNVSASIENEEELLAEVEKARRDADSIGGVVDCVVSGMPSGVGNPVYDKLHARLASAMMSINAAMGFEYGEGFAASRMRGSEMADRIGADSEGALHYLSNHCGGINGGISNGEDITMRVAFKPTPSISIPLESVTASGSPTVVSTHGRHDPCVALRAVVVVEAMAALTIADFLIERQGYSCYGKSIL